MGGDELGAVGELQKKKYLRGVTYMLPVAKALTFLEQLQHLLTA